MKWKDSDEVLESGDEGGNSYEEDYSPLRNRTFDLGTKLTALITQPISWIIAAGLGLVFFIAWVLFPANGNNAQISSLNQRIQQLEGKVTSLENKILEMDDLIVKARSLPKTMTARLDRLESKFGNQLNSIHKQLKQVKNSQAQQKKASAPPKISSKKSIQKGAKTYNVQKGDTLYSISKQFSISVSQIRKLNKLSRNETIFPGQKLVVKP